MPALVFQPVETAQIDELAEFVRRYYEEDGIRFVPDLVRPALARLLVKPGLGRAFFFVDDEQIRCGYVVFTFGFEHEVGGPLATITDLFVEPSHRREGMGKAALAFVAETCRQLGVLSLELQPKRLNFGGQALYRSFGFRESERVSMFLSLD